MIGCIKAELYKLLFNKFLYLRMILVVFVSILCTVMIKRENRLLEWIYYFSFIWLLISNFVVGSIVSDEYHATLKNLVLAVPDRKKIFISKTISCIVALHIIYIIYSIALIRNNDNVYFYILFNQYIAVFQHTMILVGIAIVSRSFSSLSVITIIMLCMYREFSIIDAKGIIQSILESTYCSQFTNVESMTSFCFVCLTSMILSLLIGDVVLKKQDIK